MELTFLASNVWFCPGSLGCRVSGSRCSRQGHMWAHFHGVGLKLDQQWVVHSYKFYTTVVTVCLALRTDCRLEALWLG